jgi:hypothetical protein
VGKATAGPAIAYLQRRSVIVGLSLSDGPCLTEEMPMMLAPVRLGYEARVKGDSHDVTIHKALCEKNGTWRP